MSIHIFKSGNKGAILVINAFNFNLSSLIAYPLEKLEISKSTNIVGRRDYWLSFNPIPLCRVLIHKGYLRGILGYLMIVTGHSRLYTPLSWGDSSMIFIRGHKLYVEPHKFIWVLFVCFFDVSFFRSHHSTR